MHVAAIQLNSTGDKARNVESAERLVRAAAADGAELVALPEKWNLLGPGEEMAAGAEPLDGPSLTAARGWARELRIHLLAGSIAERGAPGADDAGAAPDAGTDRPGKAFNTSVLIGPGGEDLAVYRKIHMFDVVAGGVEYRESEHEQAGEEIVTAALERQGLGPSALERQGLGPSAERVGREPAAPEPVTLGLSVCYDLRFPELYRILAVRGAQLIAVPSAFTLATGRDHWEVLLRARAIENQAFVLAPNQVGEAPPHYSSFGRSTIVDPWGVVLATAPDEECFVAADLDFGAQERVRETLPSLANRRPRAYVWPQLLEAMA